MKNAVQYYCAGTSFYCVCVVHNAAIFIIDVFGENYLRTKHTFRCLAIPDFISKNKNCYYEIAYSAADAKAS